MPTSFLHSRKHTYSKSLIIAGGVVTIIFVAMFMSVVHDTGRREYDKARQSAENIVGTINVDLQRNIELYDLSLQAVIANLKLPDIDRVSAVTRQALLFGQASTAKHMGSIFVLDQTGQLILDSSNTNPVNVDYAATDYFQFHLLNGDDGPHIGRPWTNQKGERLVSISRRMSGLGGSFLGVVVGTMKLDYFTELFNAVKLHDGDGLGLVQFDGRVVMRAPFDASVIGRDMSKSPVFRRMIRERVGSFEDIAMLDGVKRLFVFRQVPNSNLMMSYNLSIDSIYAGWWKQASQLLIIVVLVSIANLILIIFLARALNRSARAEYNAAVAASTDGLTGLFNRRHFDEVLGNEWRRAQRAQVPVAMLMIDADSFKDYNDRFGHQAGDTALVAIAASIQNGAQRAGDLCARYGGEEFSVVLPGIAAKEALGIAERIRENVLSLRAEQQGRPDSTPTISVGVASMLPRLGLEPRDLVKAADMALYRAKENGRNRSELASSKPVAVETTFAA